MPITAENFNEYALTLQNLGLDARNLWVDGTDWWENKSDDDKATIALADLKKVAGDITSLATTVASDPKFAKNPFLKAIASWATTDGDLSDLQARLNTMSEAVLAGGSGNINPADLVGSLSDVLDFIGNIASYSVVFEEFAFGAKVFAWILGEAAASIPPNATISGKPPVTEGASEGNPAGPSGTITSLNNTPQSSTSGTSVPADEGSGSATQTNGATISFSSSSSGLINSDTIVEPDGIVSSSTETVNSNATKTNYLNGSYAIDTIGNSGNETIVYYNAAGLAVGDSWSYSDGSSGSESFFNNGLTQIPGATSDYSVPTTSSKTLQNPDGSYELVTADGNDEITTTNYAADGSQTSSTTKQGAGQNFTSDPTYQVVSDHLVQTFNAVTDALVSDVWNNDAGQSGSDVFNNSGADSGEMTFSDGSHDTYTLYGTPDTPFEDYVMQGKLLLTFASIAGSGLDATLNQFDASGVLTGSQWQMADGAQGSYTFTSTGAGNGTMTHANGSQSTISLDGSGDITVSNLSSSGGVVSSDWWNADGTHGVTTFDNGSVTSKYTYELNGDVVVDSYASDGMNEDTLQAGEVLSADGNFFVKVVNADGTYSINYEDFNGDTLVFNYSGSTLTGTDQVSLSRNPPGEYSGTLSDGTSYTSPYNTSSAVFTDADGTTRTVYFDNTGKEVGDDWTATDGSYGSDNTHSDGSSEGRHVNADGSYYDYQDDGAGNTSTQFYNTDGSITQDQWTDADGSKGVDAYFADGSWQSNTYAADGSYNVYVENATGDYSYTYFGTNGVKTSDQWVNADGTWGDDTFNADGSSSGEAYTVQNVFSSTYSVDTAGDKTTDFYDGTGDAASDIVEDNWTRADGSSGVNILGAQAVQDGFIALGNAQYADGSTSRYTTTFSGYTSTEYYAANGDLIGTSWSAADGTHASITYGANGAYSTSTYAADGSYTSTVNDGMGDQVTTNYGAGGEALSDRWNKAGGTSGTDTFNGDGSRSGTTENADGSHTTFVTTAAGVTTSQEYAARGTFDGSQISFVDAAGNVEAANYDINGVLIDWSVSVTNTTGTTTTHYSGADGAGLKLSDTWSTKSGSFGSDIYDAAGDTIESAVNGGAGWTAITLYGSANESVTGDAYADTITGNAGNDTLVAGSGTADTLVAGSGNDVLVATANNPFVTMNSGNPAGSGTGSTTFVMEQDAHPVTINAGPKDTLELNNATLLGVSYANGIWTLTGASDTDWSYPVIANISGPIGNFSLDGKTSMSFTEAMADLSGGQELCANGGSDYFETSTTSTVLLPLLNNSNSLGLTLSGSKLMGTANDSDCTLSAQNGDQDTLVGGAGNDTLNMTIGSQTAGVYDGVMVGGTGATTFNLTSYTEGAVELLGTSSKDTLYLELENANAFYAQSPVWIQSMQQLADGSVLVNLASLGTDNIDLVIGTGGDYLQTITTSFSNPLYATPALDQLLQNFSGQQVSSTTVTLPYDVVYMALTGSADIAATANTLDDIIYANTGNDTLYAGVARDTLVAGAGNDSLIGSTGAVTMLGGSGSDTMVGGTGAAVMTGGSGHDTMIAGAGVDTFTASTGAITVLGAKSSDEVDFGNTPIADVSATSSTTSGITTVTLTSSLGGSVAIVGGSVGEVAFGSNGALSLPQLLGTAQTVYSSTGGTLDQEVSSLTLTGTANLSATGNALNDLITANSGNDVLTSGTGVDTLVGGTGNDTLVSGSARNVLLAGGGATTFVVNNSADIVKEANDTNNDMEMASVSVTLADNLHTLIGVGSQPLTLTGNSLSDVIIAPDGDTLIGGSGATTLIGGADCFEEGGSGPTTITGGAYSTEVGGSGPTLMTGGDNSRLVAGTGLSTMVGGAAYGVEFQINNAADVIEASPGASDLEMSTVSAKMVANVNALEAIADNIVVTGSDADAVFLAGAGVNDTMVSGSGITNMGDEENGFHEIFVVNNSSDGIYVYSQAGQDVEESSVSIVLANNMQSLVGIGDAALSLTGNSTNDDIITANSGADTLTSGSGNDTLIAGVGADALIGGTGNDVFVINSAQDVIQEAANTGSNIEETSISTVLADNVQNLTGLGAADLMLTGNSVGGTITANTGNDTLVAGSAATTLVGGSGADLLIGNAALGSGTATQYVLGGAGGNVTIQGSGADDSLVLSDVDPALLTVTSTTGTVNGVSGQTIFTLQVIGGRTISLDAPASVSVIFADGSTQTLSDLVAANAQTTVSASSTTLSAGMNRLVLTGSADLVGTGNDTADLLFANNGNDTLIAGSGVATMYGGAGNDVFVVNNAADVIFEAANSGQNIEQTSVSTTLAANVEQLAGVGSTALVLTGGSNGGVITANSGADTLVDGGGATTMIGGAAGDTFEVSNAADVVSGAAGTLNTELTTASVTAGANVQVLTDVDPNGDSLVLTGNALNDLITGGFGSDELVAGSGTDTLVGGSGGTNMIGGSGNDTFVLGTASDTIQESANAGSNNEVTAFTVKLADNVQNLTGTGAAAIKLTGNTLNDVITANNGKDTLVAGSGQDTLVSGTGIDSMVGGTGNDVFVVNNASDVVVKASNSGSNTEQSSVSVTLAANVQNLTGIGSSAIKLTGNTLADVITANSGNDTLVAGSGADTLVSGTGVDSLVGGAGNDVFVVNNASDVVTKSSNSGNNTEQTTVSVTLAANVQNLTGLGSAALSLTGNTLADTITANSGADTLVSGAGIDTLVGGAGNDVFVVNNASDFITKAANSGNNTEQASVSVTLAANVQNLTGTGTAALMLTGNALNDAITANTGADTLVAGSGADTLVSGSGVDALVGGTGNDVFVVNNASDVITEAVNSGSNTEQASVSVTLAANVQNLTGTGTAALALTGNTLNNVITANSGADTLVSGGGVDTLVGGTGNDVFVVNNASDVITKASNSGSNTEQSSVSVALAANVQNLTGIGSAAIALTGNTLANVITANSGNDTLIAGSGVDTLVGGAGNDVFVVNSASDVITEATNTGNNTEQSSVSVTLAANVQNLTGTGTSALKLTGNTLNDVITANSGADTLVAGSGADTLVSGTGVDSLVGGTGNDVFVVNNASDVITKASNSGSNTEQSSVSVTLAANVQNLTGTGTGALTLTGNTLANVITANSGADKLVAGSGLDTLVSGTGIDTLTGGAANNVFVVNNASDVITKATNTGSNTEQTSVSVTLAANVQNLTGIGTSALTLTGNTLANTLTANSGADTLVSGTGVDTLVGGTGNDVFVISNASDVITEATNTGNNTEQTSVSVTLAANVQNLTGTGTAALTLTGNTLNNVITANTGADKLVAGSGLDTLVSGTGVDTLVGGTANNLFVVNNASDVITKATNTGSNTEQSSVSVTLAANVQNLTGIGTGPITLTGNTLNDVITANSGNDTLVAGSGSDTVLGAAGNYSVSIGAESDTVTLGDGNDTIVSADAAANAETFQVGNGTNQVTLGSGTDHVTLGNGVDTVSAKAGTDTLTLGTGQYALSNTGAVENVVLTTGAENQLWFAQVGNNLQINVLGSGEQITVDNWFTTGTKLNQLTSSDGHTINAAGIGQLVQAMASFAVPTAGQSSYTTQEQTALAPVLAANWH